MVHRSTQKMNSTSLQWDLTQNTPPNSRLVIVVAAMLISAPSPQHDKEYDKRKDLLQNQPVISVVCTLLSVREVWGSIPGSVKSDTVSPTACHRCDVSSELCCQGAKQRRWAPLLVTRFGVISREY